MKALALAPQFDSPGKHDATGAFRPEAKRFCDFHRLPSDSFKMFDNRLTMPRRRAQVAEIIRKAGQFDALAYFGHGQKHSVQMGFQLVDLDVRNARAEDGSVPELANLLCNAGCKTVVLYACDTGRDLDLDRNDDSADWGGDGGFADRLRDLMSARGPCVVYAHTSAGHTTHNPLLRCFRSPAGVGGKMFPQSKQWRLYLQGNGRFDVVSWNELIGV